MIACICSLQDPIKQPLLRRIASQPDDSEMRQKAITSFLDILSVNVVHWGISQYVCSVSA